MTTRTDTRTDTRRTTRRTTRSTTHREPRLGMHAHQLQAALRRAGAAMALWLTAGLCAAATPAPQPNCPPAAAPLDEAAVRQGMREARDRGFLWRIDKDGKRSWLYGTIHAAERGWMFPGPTVLQALRAVDRIAFELDLLDPTIVARLKAASVAPAGAPPLPDELAKRLAAQAQTACVGNALNGLRPEMQAITLLALSGRAQGLDPAYGIDGFLAGFARGLHKQVLSLETPELQIRLLVREEPAASQKLVAELLDEVESGSAQKVMARLADDWSEGRLDDMARYGEWCDCMKTEEQREFQRLLIDQRNEIMARRVSAIHEAGHAVFIAVGSLHMIGPRGLPALLEAQGFKVEPVSLAVRAAGG